VLAGAQLLLVAGPLTAFAIAGDVTDPEQAQIPLDTAARVGQPIAAATVLDAGWAEDYGPGGTGAWAESAATASASRTAAPSRAFDSARTYARAEASMMSVLTP
jgi:hypothetical protein